MKHGKVKHDIYEDNQNRDQMGADSYNLPPVVSSSSNIYTKEVKKGGGLVTK